LICLTLMELSIEADLQLLEQNRELIDMVELRLDMLTDPMLIHPDIVKLKFGIPSIITYRKKVDGGKYQGSETYRRTVLYKYSKSGFDYIDLEMDTSFPEIEKSALDNGTKIIRSYHNFSGVPDNLESIIRQLASGPGEIAKAAVFPQNSSEILQLFEIINKIKDIEDKIVLGMGDFGLPTRILYKKIGSILTFCSISDNSGAPGQLNPEDMINIYGVNRINKNTSIYGIIGNPVMHSKSPILHNRAYRRAKMDAVYIPFLVDNIDSFFKLALFLNISGFSVTVPYKVDILNYIDERSPELESIKSCNTVVRNDQLWKGFNTDLKGFLKPLLSLNNLSSFEKCAVIGAGGASRSVVFALKSIGKEVSIFNRSINKAKKLAEEAGCSYFPITSLDLLYNFDLIVQTTSVGMTPEDDETPLPGYKFKSGQIVYDIVYTPLKTKFLKDAEISGAITIGGMEMLKIQGIEQFEIFTKQFFPQEEQKENF